MKPNRIYILGTTGTGKTHLAYQLSKKLKIKTYSLDEVYWKRKYDLKRTNEERINELNKIIINKKWIIEGVFSHWTKEAMKKSDVVIFLDIPFHKISYRILKRFFRKNKKDKDEGIKSNINLMRQAWKYRRSGNPKGQLHHKIMLEKHTKNIIIIRNNKDVEKLMEEI